MKTKKRTKLSINKATISNLNPKKMDNARGGMTETCPSIADPSCKPIQCNSLECNYAETVMSYCLCTTVDIPCNI